MNVRWGILGTGRIAHAFAEALALLPDATLAAVGSRTQAAADAFGRAHDISHCFGSYQSLCSSADVDVVYIATPHAFHARDTTMALDAGKAVLCEKAFAVNAGEASAVIELARSKNQFLMEAMWTRFVPAVSKLREWIEAGSIGEVTHVHATLGFPTPYDPKSRLFAKETAGGALLDLGVYPLSFLAMLLGTPSRVSGVMFPASNGVDMQCAGALAYESGALGTFAASFAGMLPCEGFIQGTEGWIRVHAPVNAPESLTRGGAGTEPETCELPYLGNGYPHEAMEVMNCLAQGRTESEIMPLDETLSVMRTMDALRALWGLTYPGESPLSE